jgi:hypothetical protein
MISHGVGPSIYQEGHAVPSERHAAGAYVSYRLISLPYRLICISYRGMGEHIGTLLLQVFGLDSIPIYDCHFSLPLLVVAVLITLTLRLVNVIPGS